jgi:radical SAM protein with 4Fe4S-binding SPASM domain
MELLNYSEFSKDILNRLSHRRVPLTGAIELTRRCHLNCIHCYNNLPFKDPEALENELTYEQHRRMLDEMVDAGCLWLLYTGGEILLRRDFLEIYSYAKHKGLLITLFTNGTLLTPKIVDRLAHSRPFSIEITLYGRTKETYERITRVAGSFEMCLRGIDLLLQHKLPLKLKSMALTTNKHELGDMKKFAENELGVEFRFDAMISPRLDTSPGPLSVRLSPEEIVTLDLGDPKRMTEWMDFCERFKGPADIRDGLYSCGGGITAFAVDPYGKMTVCPFSQTGAYDLACGTFSEGWAHLKRVREKKAMRQTKCSRCEIKAMCGMCPANGELESRDAEEPVDFMCRVAHLRAKALGLAVRDHGPCEHCR